MGGGHDPDTDEDFWDSIDTTQGDSERVIVAKEKLAAVTDELSAAQEELN
jgi:hypothetical protein